APPSPPSPYTTLFRSVVDPRTLQPLDVETLVESVKKTNRVVVAHEAVTRGGFGAEVAAVLQQEAFDWLDAPIERVEPVESLLLRSEEHTSELQSRGHL